MSNEYEMPAVSDSRRKRLIEVAEKRLRQYQIMKKAQEDARLRPRGGLDFDYQESIDLMLITLASLTAEPVCGGGYSEIFIAPPVPAAIPVRLPDAHQDANGNEWLHKESVIKAIRATGQEVKTS